MPLIPILGDDDSERKKQAEVLLNTYNRELERMRLAAAAQGLLVAEEGAVHHSPISFSSVLISST